MTTKAKANRWVYLADMHNGAAIQNLTTGEIRQVYVSSVQGGAKIGLRGYVLEELDGSYVETGELIHPADEELFDHFISHYHNSNGWNYDYPHWEFESNVTPQQLADLKAKLEGMMAPRGFKFEVIGLAPRSLLYFSDGGHKSQKKFVSMVPHPNGVPWRRDGSLKTRYQCHWSSTDRDNGVPYPHDHEKKYGTLSPMLYCGPAAVVRFLVEDQQPAFGNCRVYVTMDGDFICSDWCQRHDFSSYGSGINLQTGIYSFDSWIVGPCLSRAMQQKVFKPKGATVTIEPVRELLKKTPAPMQSLDEALKDAKRIVASAAPATGNKLGARVTAALAATPDADVDTIVTGILDDLAGILKVPSNTSEELIGLPVLVPKSVCFISDSNTQKAYSVDLNTYRFQVSQPNCGATLYAGKVCVKDGHGKMHQHLHFQHVAIDAALVRKQLEQLIDAAREAQKPVVDVPPITADALAEAKAVLADRETKRLETERAELLQANITKALQIGTVEVLPDVLPSVQPLIATHDSIYGTVQISRFTDDTVQVQWLSGAYKDEPVRYVRREEGQYVSYAGSPAAKKSQPGLPLGPLAPLLAVVEWYYEEFLPNQLKAQKALVATAAAVTIDDESFRCYPVVGGATVCKVVDGAVSEAVTVRQQANGHIYEVLESGKTAVLQNGPVKAAASYYLKNLLRPGAAAQELAGV